MNRLSKAILVVCISLAAVALIAIVGVNLYVQSPGTQTRIQEEISRALNIPLRITSTSVTPWGGLRIVGITVPGEGANFLEASSFSARYRLLPLLRGRLTITTMFLDSPKIVWAQNSEGKWVLPALPDQRDQKQKRQETAETPETAEPQGEHAGPATAAQKKPERGSKLTVTVEGFQIRDGSIELQDAAGTRVAHASGVQMNYTGLRSHRVEGTLKISHLSWKDTLFFTEVTSPFRYVKGELTLSDIQAALAGGTVKGDASMNPDKKDGPFELALDWEKIDFARITTEAGWAAGQAAGVVDGKIRLKGETRHAERAEGKGEVVLRDGQLRQLGFFQTLGQVLQISELTNLRVRKGRSEFRLADEKLWVDHLSLETPDLKLAAKGMVRFDGKLALNAELGLSERLAAQLPSMLRSNLTPPDSNGVRAIPFKISGRTDRPRTDLLDTLVGQKIGSQFDEFVSNIFGLKNKKKDKDREKEKEKEKEKEDKKKKKKEEESARASEAAAAITPPGPDLSAPMLTPSAAPETPAPAPNAHPNPLPTP